MKWFKTKKDKRIEELEREIERRDRAMMLNGVVKSQLLRPQMLKFARRISVLGNMDAELAIDRVKMQVIDADAFIKAECSQCDGYCDVCNCDCLNCKSEYRCEFIKDIDSADVIIEADKEKKE